MKSFPWVKDWLLAFSIAILIFLLLEGCFRILYPDKAGQEKRVAFENNETYHVSLKPNLSRTYIRDSMNGGDHITWRTNAQSFRGQDLEEKSSLRVVVYGDSNVQARFSNVENTYPEKLER